MLNQFPCESLVTVKDCLAAVSRRVAGGVSPAWLPETFNLQTELPQFIKNYQRREKRWTILVIWTSCCILKVPYFATFLQDIIFLAGPRTCIFGLCKKIPLRFGLQHVPDHLCGAKQVLAPASGEGPTSLHRGNSQKPGSPSSSTCRISAPALWVTNSRKTHTKTCASIRRSGRWVLDDKLTLV